MHAYRLGRLSLAMANVAFCLYTVARGQYYHIGRARRRNVFQHLVRGAIWPNRYAGVCTNQLNGLFIEGK